MKKILAVFVIVVLILMILPLNASAYVSFEKRENQTHYCFGFWGYTYTWISNTTSNSLIARAIPSGGYYNFYYDDWCAIVTNTGGWTDYWSGPEQTIYYNQPSNQTFHVYYYQRTPYQVWMSPNWIKLCASQAYNIYITCQHGYVEGSVMGRFNPPYYFSPTSSIYFEAWTKINF